jgi:hypothetical protein
MRDYRSEYKNYHSKPEQKKIEQVEILLDA